MKKGVSLPSKFYRYKNTVIYSLICKSKIDAQEAKELVYSNLDFIKLRYRDSCSAYETAKIIYKMGKES